MLNGLLKGFNKFNKEYFEKGKSRNHLSRIRSIRGLNGNLRVSLRSRLGFVKLLNCIDRVLRYLDYQQISSACDNFERSIEKLIKTIGRECMLGITKRMMQKVRDKRNKEPKANPVVFLSKLCSESENKTFLEQYEETAIRDQEKEKAHIDHQDNFLR